MKNKFRLDATKKVKGRATREVAALPKGSKEVLRKGRKGKAITLSPSQPHSKTVGR